MSDLTRRAVAVSCCDEMSGLLRCNNRLLNLKKFSSGRIA